MKVRIIPHQREDAAWHLALEEALFLQSKQDQLDGKEVQPIVRMYSFNKPSVVLGYMQKINDIDAQYCHDNNVHVTMRSTGGGSVFLGEKDLQYSMILPQGYSPQLLQQINTSLQSSLQDVGIHPDLRMVDNHPLLRIENKSFVFDAERRFKNILLHHGTTLMNNDDYDHMPLALKATQEEQHHLKTGNQWLHDIQQLREQSVIHSYQKNLTNDNFIIQDFTYEEKKIARRVYRKFYANPEEYSKGNKPFGICYLPNTLYDMEKYTIEE